MFNSKKQCKCGFKRLYDSNIDSFHISNYIYCPLCGKKLQDFGYSPDF